jgi:hypothetical protein
MADMQPVDCVPGVSEFDMQRRILPDAAHRTFDKTVKVCELCPHYLPDTQ